MYFERHAAVPLRRFVHGLKPVLLEGPRGAGKTTLLQREFPELLHVDLDNATDRLKARQDPRGFLRRLRRAAVIEQVHRAPELVRLFQTEHIDEPYVLSSSIRLSLPMDRLEMHRPTLAELQRRNSLDLEVIGRFSPATSSKKTSQDAWAEVSDWPEGDLLEFVQVRDLDLLLKFADLARAASGQGLHQLELARQAGVSHRTAVRWLEALEGCFLAMRLEPISNDFGRRIVRRPKYHFLERNSCFESQIVAELYKNARHAGTEPRLRYWRDSNGLEIPLVIEQVSDGALIGVGIAEVPTPRIEAELQRWLRLSGAAQAAMISRSLPAMPRKDVRILRYEAGQL